MNCNREIRGVGNDIVSIARLRQSVERQGEAFLFKILNQKELEYCRRFQDALLHIAGRFAAKEAIVKALGTGFGASIAWQDIEILNDEKGKPIVTLAATVAEQFGFPQIMLSISHCPEYATAVAIWLQ